MTQVYEFPLLTEAEYNAISYVDCMRTIIPGRSIFNKLIKKDLCYETIEDPMEDGTEFTPSIDLTDKGVAMCHELEKYMK
jgi:hypothetical protein